VSIIRRCLVLCGLAALLVACGDDTSGDTGGDTAKGTEDYRAMTPDQVCELVTIAEARGLMKDFTDEEDTLAVTKETHVGLPACRYGSGDGKPYLQVAVYQTSRSGGATVTVAGQHAAQDGRRGSCAVRIRLAESLYLQALVESWDPSADACPAGRDAMSKAYPRLVE
jgi:uncharacterized Zn-binding protein involved in type VI secretion